MVVDRYYYNILTPREKDIYNSMYKAIVELKSSVKILGSVTMPALIKIVSAITNDNPHMYYFNQVEMSLQMSVTHTVVHLKYFYTKTEIESLNKRIETAVNTIIRKLDLESTNDEYEREKRVHDILANYVKYDHAAITATDPKHLASAHSIVGVFVDKKAVCEGIAKATKILLNTANVRCIVATGKSSLETHGLHAWNIVRVNGAAYHLDVTWDIANTEGGRVCYDYFNLSDNDIMKDHSDFKSVPACSVAEANFFAKNKVVFADTRSAKQYISRAIKNGEKSLYIKWISDSPSFAKITNELVQYAIRTAALDGYPWNARYVPNDTQGTLRIDLAIRV